MFGTQGRIYTTQVHKLVRCNCFDFRINRKPCKHIYFIIQQIAQNPKILEDLSNESLSEEAFIELDSSLKTRLKSRMEKDISSGSKEKEIDLKD